MSVGRKSKKLHILECTPLKNDNIYVGQMAGKKTPSVCFYGWMQPILIVILFTVLCTLKSVQPSTLRTIFLNTLMTAILCLLKLNYDLGIYHSEVRQFVEWCYCTLDKTNRTTINP